MVLDSGPTDLNEYGLKGQIKTMKSILYTTGKKVDGEWKTKEKDLYGISEYYYNETGNIDTNSSYNSVYTYAGKGYPIKETRTFYSGKVEEYKFFYIEPK